MVSSSASAILRLGGWSYLPDFITRTALQILHRLYATIFRRAPPAPGTPEYARNYRLTFAAVVLGYLAYNMVEASRLMPPNFYEMLDVYPDADEAKLKTAFRAFARRYHPDKVGPEGEALFIHVRDAYEALKNPVTRFAYDRFGPEALKWTKCSTVLDYLYQGLIQSIGFHLVSGAVLLAYSAIGAQSAASFWRYTLFFALMASELALILGPSATLSGPGSISSTPTSARPPSSMQENLLVFIFPRRVAYQHILFLHQLFMFMSVAVSRVAPVLFPPSIDEIDGIGTDLKSLQAVVDKLDFASKAIHLELNHMLQTQLYSVHSDLSKDDGIRFGAMRPFPQERVDPEVMERLISGMTAIAVEGRLRQAADAPGPLKSVWDSAVARVRNAVSIRGRPTPSRKVSRRTEWWERRRPSEVNAGPRVDIDLTAEPDEPKLPSPISASSSMENDLPSLSASNAAARFPSPRPSPTPQVMGLVVPGVRTPGLHRRESYLRGRSQSC